MTSRVGLAIVLSAALFAPARGDEPLAWPATARDPSGAFFRGRAVVVGERVEFSVDPGPANAPGHAPRAWRWDDLRSLRWERGPAATTSPAEKASPTPAEWLLTATGDFVPGRVVALDERTATVELAWGARSVIPRTALAGFGIASPRTPDEDERDAPFADAPLRIDATRDALRLDDGETLYGEIVDFRDGRWRIETPLGAVDAPESRVRSALFRRTAAATITLDDAIAEVPLLAPADACGRGLDGRRPRLVGAFEKVDREAITLKHPLFGPLRVPLARTAGIDLAARGELRILAGGPIHLGARPDADASPVAPDGGRVEIRFASPASIATAATLEVEWLGDDLPPDPASLVVSLDGKPLAPSLRAGLGFEWLGYRVPAGLAGGERTLTIALRNEADPHATARLGAIRLAIEPATR